MKSLIMIIMIFFTMFFLVGCDNSASTISSGANEVGSYTLDEEPEEENIIVDLEDDTTSNNTENIESQAVDYETYRAEINANAYDAEKLGPKSLIKENNYNVDIVVGDNYYATQLADMIVNFDKFEGKVVEVEGFALKNGPYTFVGRYSENAICPTCPAGYAYYEFEWHGDEKVDFGDEKNWIKVIGKITRGNDGQEYYYIDAYRIDIMDKWGDVVTVAN